MNHSWTKSINEGKKIIQECSVCGCLRQKVTRKYLMAVVNHPPWEAYMYERVWQYTTIDGNTYKRPECKPRQLIKK